MKKWVLSGLALIIISIIILIARCSFDNDSLGEGYYFLPLYEAKDIGFPGGAIIYKSSERLVFKRILVEGDVIDVNWNDSFIIAIQDKRDNRDYYAKNADDQNAEAKNYFIIRKKGDKVFGPYTETEYLQRRKEFGVPDELQFKSRE